MRRVLFILILLSSICRPDNFQAQINKAYFNQAGRIYLTDRQYEEAIDKLNILIMVDPDAYEAYMLRGVAKFNLDDLLGAEMDFTTAIEKNPVYTVAYRNRAITRTRLGNYDDALRDFQEAINLRPDLPDSYYSRGVTFLLSQQFERAIGDFDRFLLLDNRFADAYINRGRSYLNLGDTIKAFDDFNNAIRTNREDPRGYYNRALLYADRKEYAPALADLDKSIDCDSTYIPSYFTRAIVYSNTNKLMQSIADFDKVLALDPHNAQTYYNRAILRMQIGDYNRALEDFNKVASYSPGNVLVFYNRAGLNMQLGNLEDALADFTRAIELYPDFANAYLYRSSLRELLHDDKGSRTDRKIADRKIEEYRSKLTDSTFSIYADTSRKFNQLLSFESGMAESGVGQQGQEAIAMMPLFRFSLVNPDSTATANRYAYYQQRLEEYRTGFDDPWFNLTTQQSDMPTDSLFKYDELLGEVINRGQATAQTLMLRGITQTLIKQYTSAVNTYTEAIDRDPTNPFLYLNRSTARSEMIDFISSIDNSRQRITIESDPASSLHNNSTRTYNYDEAIADLNKAAKLMPELAYIYYNRGYLQAFSDRLPEAFDDFSKAIELYPEFAEAYFNRGLVQIYMKDTLKGCLDISKAGELGIVQAYEVLKRYAYKKNGE